LVNAVEDDGNNDFEDVSEEEEPVVKVSKKKSKK
jgi:hypothetical protein